MIYFLKFWASFLLPPGIIILALLAFNIWLYRLKKRAAKILSIIIVFFYIISTNYFGGIILKFQESQYNPPPISSGDVIIMLGGGATLDTPDFDGLGNLSGNAANRLLTAARLQRQLNVPIILSGGQVFEDSGREAVIGKRMLLGIGIPEDMIIVEDSSFNTKQNAEYTKRILDVRGFRKPILVTSAFHMERSVLNFLRIGVAVTPFPTDYLANRKNDGLYLNNFVPSADGLRNVSIVLRERLGILAMKVW